MDRQRKTTCKNPLCRAANCPDGKSPRFGKLNSARGNGRGAREQMAKPARESRLINRSRFALLSPAPAGVQPYSILYVFYANVSARRSVLLASSAAVGANFTRCTEPNALLPPLFPIFPLSLIRPFQDETCVAETTADVRRVFIIRGNSLVATCRKTRGCIFRRW